MTWQLWLAPSHCFDAPLLWQRPQDKLAPGQVALAFATILAAIGSPANAPKPRGKSPGRALGGRPSPRTRYPTVKKRAPRAKKTQKVSNLTPAQRA